MFRFHSLFSCNKIQDEPEMVGGLPRPRGPPWTPMGLLPPWLSSLSPGVREEGHPCLPEASGRPGSEKSGPSPAGRQVPPRFGFLGRPEVTSHFPVGYGKTLGQAPACPGSGPPCGPRRTHCRSPPGGRTPLNACGTQCPRPERRRSWEVSPKPSPAPLPASRSTNRRQHRVAAGIPRPRAPAAHTGPTAKLV